MPTGPGKYDLITSFVREQTHAQGVLIIVIEGTEGSGFSAQLPPHLLSDVPRFLREMADEIELSTESPIH